MGKSLAQGKPAIARLAPDAQTAALYSIQVTLHATPATVTTITLPTDAMGFRIRPAAADVRFAVDENPAANATSTSQTIAASSLAKGNTAKATEWETRLLAYGMSHTLRLIGAAGSEVVQVEIF